MNGIRALYKCAEDAELESQNLNDKWRTNQERLEDNQSYALEFLLKEGWKVRKRQSPIDECVDEIFSMVHNKGYSRDSIKAVVLKHWLKGGRWNISELI